jgi:glycosyltransferase involved in cell wall biosynthesis
VLADEHLLLGHLFREYYDEQFEVLMPPDYPEGAQVYVGRTGMVRLIALLRRLAVGRDVSFLGPVAEAALPGLYRGATVLALPSVERTCYGRHIPVSELQAYTQKAIAEKAYEIAANQQQLP